MCTILLYIVLLLVVVVTELHLFFSQCISNAVQQNNMQMNEEIINIHKHRTFLLTLSTYNAWNHIFHSFNSKIFRFSFFLLSFRCIFLSLSLCFYDILHTIRIEHYSVTNNVHLHLLFIALNVSLSKEFLLLFLVAPIRFLFCSFKMQNWIE